jgi:carbamoyl-phosphate synthase large subunit
MNIMLTSVGRRGYLVSYFKQALGDTGRVWGADNNRHTPAFTYCHQKAILPEVSNGCYVDTLLKFCRRNSIDMVIPLIDPELEVLAVHRQKFLDQNITVVVSPPQTVEICYDKYKTYQFGKDSGIPVPETVVRVADALRLLADGRLSWPLVVKPRRGSASADITWCHDEPELRFAYEHCPAPMIQENVEGDEYGYDLFGDDRFRPVSVYCKKKLLMRAGETDKAVSTSDKELIDLGVKIIENLRLFGPCDVDVMVGKDGPKLLELNPRFGGGYPCAHLCGGNFPQKLIAICEGKEVKPDIGSCPDGVYMFKQDEIITAAQSELDSIPDARDK